MNSPNVSRQAGLSESESALKAEFYRKLTLKYHDSMRLLFRGGELWGPSKEDERGWHNVIEHQVVQTAAAEELVKLLKEALTAERIVSVFGVQPEELDALPQTTIIHDWDKKFERKGGEPDEWARRHLETLHPDPLLMEATKIDTLEQLYLGNKTYTMMQKLQFYLDIITRENEIVASEDRIAEVESSSRAAELAAKANGMYWQATRAMAKDVEAMLFGVLSDSAPGLNLKEPSDIARVLRERIEAHWKKR